MLPGSMVDGPGAERSGGTGSSILMLTTFDADELVLRALRAGAAGFLLKDSPPAEIVRAIELVDALSPRELEVARAVGRGLSNADISAELHLSVATVKAHVSRLLEKLGADNGVQIALLIRDASPPGVAR
jgi:DNA-binding NarL/FixJ family response regulator